MRVLLDECVPRALREQLPGHDVKTVAENGWAGVKNGELLRLAAQRFDGRERSRVGRAAAQTDQVRAAGEIVERVDHEVAVVRERRHEPLAEEVLHLHPEAVAEHVHVADEHHGHVVGRRTVLRFERVVHGRVAVRRGAALRGFAYVFIELFSPRLTRKLIETALAGKAETYEL